MRICNRCAHKRRENLLLWTLQGIRWGGKEFSYCGCVGDSIGKEGVNAFCLVGQLESPLGPYGHSTRVVLNDQRTHICEIVQLIA
jgi:hypothetical protein